MADPFTIAALGIGTAATLGKGIYDAATLGDRKKKWKREQEEKLRRDLTMDYMDLMSSRSRMPQSWRMGMKAKYGQDDIDKAAEENFQFDPMTFVPFVQQGTQLAGGIYDAAQPSRVTSTVGPSSGVRMSVEDFFDPEEMQHYRGRR